MQVIMEAIHTYSRQHTPTVGLSTCRRIASPLDL